MRFYIIPLFLALTSCAGLKSLEIGVGAATSPRAMTVAANGFDAVEITAAGYVGFCTPKPMPATCSVAVVRKIIKAVQAGRIARNNLEAFVKANPGQPGPTTLVNALTTATAALQQIEVTYGIGAKS